MNAREERLQEVARFAMTVKREFPTVATEMAKDVTRWGKVTESASRLVCRCPDRETRNKLVTRFGGKNWNGSGETAIVFNF